jgi:hypothetical protein
LQFVFFYPLFIMSQNIEYRTSVVLAPTLAAGNEFTTPSLNLTFDPDEVIVREVMYNTLAGGERIPLLVTCDFLIDSNAVLCTVFEGTHVCPNNVFQLRRSVQGHRTFKVLTAGVSPPTVGTGAGVLVLILEFVKYRPAQTMEGLSKIYIK